MESAITAVVGLLGVAGGAVLQYWLSRRMWLDTRRSELVTRAYADYLLGVAGVAQSQRHKDQNDIREYHRQLADAKSRIAVYGEPKVVQSMAAFERLGAKLESPEQKRAFVSIVQAMRGNGYAGDASINEQDVMRILFGGED